MACRKALLDSKGDMEKAILILQKEGVIVAGKKGTRDFGAGVIGSYVHSTGDIGAMVELLCETDFVAKNIEFKTLAYDLAMQLAAIPAGSVVEFLEQEFIKAPEKKVQDLINAATQKFGERIEVGDISRLSILGR